MTSAGSYMPLVPGVIGVSTSIVNSFQPPPVGKLMYVPPNTYALPVLT